MRERLIGGNRRVVDQENQCTSPSNVRKTKRGAPKNSFVFVVARCDEDQVDQESSVDASCQRRPLVTRDRGQLHCVCPLTRHRGFNLVLKGDTSVNLIAVSEYRDIVFRLEVPESNESVLMRSTILRMRRRKSPDPEGRSNCGEQKLERIRKCPIHQQMCPKHTQPKRSPLTRRPSS